MVGSIPDPESSRDRLQAWKGRIDQLAADMQAMSDRMQTLRVTVSDPNHMVSVTVDSTGSLLDLQLTERSRRVEIGAVSGVIMETIREANPKSPNRPPRSSKPPSAPRPARDARSPNGSARNWRPRPNPKSGGSDGRWIRRRPRRTAHPREQP